MREDWKTFLCQAGANISGNCTVDFGNPIRERKVVLNGSIIADLSQYGLIAAYGADARQFLQNQLTNDFSHISEQHCQLSGYCNPKGRLFALFHVFQRGDTFYLQLPRELIEPVIKRLRMFVLNSKVTLEDASDSLVRIGYSSTKANQELASIFSTLPAADYDCVSQDGVTLMKLASPLIPRYEIVGEVASISKLWHRLDVNAAPVGLGAWRLLEIQSGQPQIFQGTYEEFVPQMVNLDVIEGVSFKKGCYPGQEIVARVRYLGKIKRRMFLAHLAEDALLAAGASLYRRDNNESHVTGNVVMAAAGPDGGQFVLCVLENTHKNEVIYPDQTGKTSLQLMELPYSVEI